MSILNDLKKEGKVEMTKTKIVIKYTQKEIDANPQKYTDLCNELHAKGWSTQVAFLCGKNKLEFIK